LALVASLLALSASAQSRPPVIEPPLMRAPAAERPIQLVGVKLRAEAAGTLVRSKLDLVFLNPNTRTLEGELQFPLAEGQVITGFALEAPDGHMMPAVPVPKAKGQEVFENIERRNVDPALLEQTQGRNFKLRVYPLLPGKPRRISLELTELLSPDAKGLVHYRTPLALGAAARAPASLWLSAQGVAPRELVLEQGLAQAQITPHAGQTQLLWETQELASGTPPAVAWPVRATPSVLFDRFDGNTYFHAELAMAGQGSPRPRPANVALVWDASGSGAQRDHERELALLDAWFKQLGNVKVQLVVARDVAEPVQAFDVRQGQWPALRRVLETMVYDGASNAAAWANPAGLTDGVVLLFGDGLANWGSQETPASTLPRYTLSASAQTNSALLRSLAEPTGGQHIDLLQRPTRDALADLQRIAPAVTNTDSQGVQDLVLAGSQAQAGRLRLAGRLVAGQGSVVLHLRSGEGPAQTITLALRPPAQVDETGLASQRWARYKIDALEARPRINAAQITRLGNQFGVLSSQTSLIVLESLADHLRYDIAPPAGPWRTEFDQQRQAKAATNLAQRSRHLDSLAQRFAAQVAWWETDFPKGTPPPPPEEKRKTAGALAAAADAQASQRESAVARPMAVPTAAPAPPPPMPAPVAAGAAARQSADQAAPGSAVASISLQQWQPDSPFARRLREASADNRYAIYMDERPSYQQSTGFFLDAASVFFDKGQTDLALRILSNLAEMDLENRQILRVLAYRLNQAGRPDLALPLLQRVRDLAPNEPQSWRDLGLTLAEAGQHQAAIDALWEVASRPWDSRFADIDLIALAELNALAARQPGLNLGAVDARVRRNLPLDLRAVLTWDADNTDIDLWVIDPNNEKAFYSHPNTYQGGRMSRDFTAGYGPEAFSLKQAKPGRYEVRAQFYGHRQQALLPYTTLMLKLSTGFGTAAQKDQTVVLRLTSQRDEVLVGTFEVK
jgi:tetratricopeptide (TPR) repeat protein